MSIKADRAAFLEVLREEFPNRPRYEVEAFGRRLMRMASTSNRIAELLCSVEMRPAEQERVEKRDEKNDAAIESLCRQWGLTVRIDGDPRGYTIKVLLPSGRYNTWGGAECGWGVPATGYTAAELARMGGW